MFDRLSDWIYNIDTNNIFYVLLHYLTMHLSGFCLNFQYSNLVGSVFGSAYLGKKVKSASAGNFNGGGE